MWLEKEHSHSFIWKDDVMWATTSHIRVQGNLFIQNWASPPRYQTSWWGVQSVLRHLDFQLLGQECYFILFQICTPDKNIMPHCPILWRHRASISPCQVPVCQMPHRLTKNHTLLRTFKSNVIVFSVERLQSTNASVWHQHDRVKAILFVIILYLPSDPLPHCIKYDSDEGQSMSRQTSSMNCACNFKVCHFRHGLARWIRYSQSRDNIQ